MVETTERTLTRSQSAGLAFTVMATILTAVGSAVAGASAFDPTRPTWFMLGAPILGLLAVWLASRSTLPQEISRAQTMGLLLTMTCAVVVTCGGVATGAFFIKGNQELLFALALIITAGAGYLLYQVTFVTFTTK